jgi:hypothetical protein
MATVEERTGKTRQRRLSILVAALGLPSFVASGIVLLGWFMLKFRGGPATDSKGHDVGLVVAEIVLISAFVAPVLILAQWVTIAIWSRKALVKAESIPLALALLTLAATALIYIGLVHPVFQDGYR